MDSTRPEIQRTLPDHGPPVGSTTPTSEGGYIDASEERQDDYVRPTGVGRNIMTPELMMTFISARTHYSLYKQSGRLEDLEDTIKCFREVGDLHPDPHVIHAAAANSAANALCDRFELLDEIKDLDDAIRYYRQILAYTSEGRATCLNNLACALSSRFRRLGRLSDLEEASILHRETLELRPPGHPDRAVSLGRMADTLVSHFKQSGNRDELEEAVAHNREALLLRPEGHPARSASLNKIASVLSVRYHQLGSTHDLEEAIAYHREALFLRPEGHPDRFYTLSNLSTALLSRFESTSRPDDLDEAIIHQRTVLVLSPKNHSDRPGYIIDLANALSTRFDISGGVEDLENAVQLHREALTICPKTHLELPSFLGSLSSSLLTRFDKLGERQDLEEAIDQYRKALALCRQGSSEQSGFHNSLGAGLFTRFKQTQDMNDLEEAVTHQREALRLCPPVHYSRSTFLNNFANTVSARHELLGRMEDLEQALLHHREALGLLPHDHPSRPSVLNNLSHDLRLRYEHLANKADLHEAIVHHREALASCPDGHQSRSHCLANLGDAVITGSTTLQDVEEGVAFFRQTLALRPEGHPLRYFSLHQLAGSLLALFQRSAKTEHLEEAITLNQAALRLDPVGHVNRSDSLVNLGKCLRVRFDQSHLVQDLHKAIEYYTEAMIMLPHSHPRYALIGSQLASIYLKLHDELPDASLVTKAFELFETSVNQSSSSSMFRLVTALQWSSTAQRYHHSSVLLAYSRALTILQRLIVINPTVESQHRFMGIIPTRSLALDAAASATMVGNLENAVELLEQGRAILWSRMRGYRYSLDHLRDYIPELAAQFETLSAQLEHLAVTSESQILTDGYNPERTTVLEMKMQTQRILSEKWDIVVGDIRKVDGFESFLQPVPFSTLRSTSAEGPVVLINLSEYRCDAIILLSISAPVLVPLPKTSLSALEDLHLKFLIARDALNPRLFVRILKTLWNDVVQPITDRLTVLGVPRKSRVWWCPTSYLCGLPLHAAGPYDNPNDFDQLNLPNLFVSSYTPTLSALIAARANLVPASSLPRLLVIAQPSEDLATLNDEVSEIQQLGDFVTVLTGKEATPSVVLSQLQQHSRVHFACHGYQHPQPFQSSFHVHEGEVSLLDLIKARLPHADFAFLSACYTATGDALTPDEVIHLAAALQFSGFRSVVGTLWKMVDLDGPFVTKEFYRYVFRNGLDCADLRDSAVALNSAMQALRRKEPLWVHRWINFIHIGA